MSLAPEQTGIGIRRHFTTAGVDPYDQVDWERRDARITDYRDGSVAFEQRDVEVPATWSVNATNILAQKYFRGTLGTAERETSLKQVVDRVVDTITAWGVQGGYFVDDSEAETFRAELKHLIVQQKAAFNSPVWFNIGVKGVPQQASACQPYDALVSTPDGLIPIGRLVEDGCCGNQGVRRSRTHVDRRGQGERSKASAADPHEGGSSARRHAGPPRLAVERPEHRVVPGGRNVEVRRQARVAPQRVVGSG